MASRAIMLDIEDLGGCVTYVLTPPMAGFFKFPENQLSATKKYQGVNFLTTQITAPKESNITHTIGPKVTLGVRHTTLVSVFGSGTNCGKALHWMTARLIRRASA